MSNTRGIYSAQFAELGKGKKSAPIKRGGKISQGNDDEKGIKGKRGKMRRKTGKRGKQWEKREKKREAKVKRGKQR